MEELPDQQKLQFVTQWLRETYSTLGKPVPTWEITPQTLDTLYQIAKRNREANHDLKIIQQDLQRKTLEFDAEAKRNEKVMKEMGTSVDSFSNSGRESLRCLSNISVTLDLKDTKDSSFEIGIGELVHQKLLTEDKSEKGKRELEFRRRDLKGALSALASLKNILHQFEESREKKLSTHSAIIQTISYLDNKKREYDQTIQTLTREVEKSNFSPAISHENLTLLYEQYHVLQEEIEPKERRLATYQDLPPDISLATLKVEETRQKILKIEREMQTKMDEMGLH